MAADRGILVNVLVLLAKFFMKILPEQTTIPQPGVLLQTLLQLLLPSQKLLQLECLSDIYFRYGLFRFDGYTYLLDPKLSQTAINKLDKGATEYLTNSPLSDSFLGSSDRSPDTRRAIAAIFRKSNMEEKGPLMVTVIERTVEKISQGAIINVNKISLQMALDVVGHVLFGMEFDALGGRQEQLIAAMMTILHRAYSLREITPDSEEFREASNDLDRLTSQVLQEAVEVERDEKSLARTLHDICGFKQCKSNMELFLMAGSETTASSIPVFLHLMASNSDLQKELQTEADEFITRLRRDASVVPPKLESAMKEMLRTYAIAPYISRRTHEEMLLGDYTLPKDSNLRIFTWGIHRCPELWSNSKSFVSDRFCPKFESADSQKRTHGDKNGFWIPFGAGARVCIGQHLAWVEMRLALTYFLHHFTFSLTEVTADLEFCVDWEHAVIHADKDVVLGVARRH